MDTDPGKTAIGIGLVILAGTALLGTGTFWLIVLCCVALVVAVVYFTQAKCPACASRGTLCYLHQRVDGGPDRRYNYNPVVCRKCGAMHSK